MPRGKPLPVLFLTVFLDLLGFGIVIPLLPFLALAFEASPWEVALLVAGYSVMQFLMAPVWGRLSDRVGRRPVMLLSIAGSVVGLVLFGSAGSYGMLLLSRLVHGGMNANIAVAQAYVADVTTPEERAKGMGFFGAAIGLGFVFGPATGGLLGQYGLGFPAFVAAALALVNLGLAFFLLPETPARSEAALPRGWKLLDLVALRRALAQPRLGAILAAAFLFMVGFSAMETTFPLWSEARLGWSERETGWLFTYLGVLIVLVQGGLIGPLRRAWGEAALVRVGLVLLAVGLALVPPSGGYALVALSMGAVAVGSGLLTPNLSALVSFEGRSAERGGTLGLYQSMNALGRVVGPLVGGGAYTLAGAASPFLLGALLMGLCLLVLVPVPVRPAPA